LSTLRGREKGAGIGGRTAGAALRLTDLTAARLRSQCLVASECTSAAEVVVRLGAMQAQDYSAALWAIGARLRDGTLADVERAIAERKIVRTWPMRGTMHFVATADVYWMLKLLTPRVIARSAPRAKQLELDTAIFSKARRIFVRALQKEGALTRDAMMATLERSGISVAGQRGYHILWRLAQEGVLCFGPHSGKQPTFVLLEEWVRPPCSFDREQALAEVARRYFAGHGPATLQDFAWWTGFPMADAKAALASVAGEFESHAVNGKTFWSAPGNGGSGSRGSSVLLLPGFDEYLLGYGDRTEVLAPEHASRIVPGGNGIFFPILVAGGRIVGTWKREVNKRQIALTISPFVRLSDASARAAKSAAKRYGLFQGLPAEASILGPP
jgi:hypothetical protein